MRPGHPAFAAAFIGAVVTLLITVLPFIQFAYREPVLHIVLDTAAAMVGLLVAFLLLGRFNERHEVSDLVLVFAMLMFAVTNLGLSALPSGVTGSARSGFSAWAPLFGRLLGSLAFGLAPLVRRRTANTERALAMTVLLLAVCVVVIAGAVEALEPRLPPVLDTGLSPEAPGRPRVVGNEFVLLVQLISMLAFAVGAAGCLRLERSSGDEFLAWCAAGGILAAFSRLNFFLFPSLYSEYFYTGDLLRLGFYLMLLVGAARQIQSYWATSAVDAERRRIARDLHDGLAQELAFILGQSRRMIRRDATPSTELKMVAGAAQRALDESRRAISLLSASSDEPLEAVLVRTAEDVVRREGATLRTEIERAERVAAAVREALVRIMREAVINACRHGRAQQVTVRFSGDDDGLHLGIEDNGSGFDMDATPRGAGFGLISMRERADSLGGRLSISSEPGTGTKVEVWLPRKDPTES